MIRPYVGRESRAQKKKQRNNNNNKTNKGQYESEGKNQIEFLLHTWLCSSFGEKALSVFVYVYVVVNIDRKHKKYHHNISNTIHVNRVEDKEVWPMVWHCLYSWAGFVLMIIYVCIVDIVFFASLANCVSC